MDGYRNHENSGPLWIRTCEFGKEIDAFNKRFRPCVGSDGCLFSITHGRVMDLKYSPYTHTPSTVR